MDLILDTNIYRNLVFGLTDEQVEELSNNIKQKCKQENIRLYFPIDSAMELISHFNDEREIERRECRKALKLLVSLSTTFSRTNLHVDFIPSTTTVLMQHFFKSGDDEAKIQGKVISLAQMLVGNLKPEAQIEMDKNVQFVKDHVEFEKRKVRDNYEELVKSFNTDGEADWLYFKNNDELRKEYFHNLKIGRLSFLVAQGFIDTAYNMTGNAIEKNQEYYDKVIKFMQTFGPALLMNELLLEKIGHGVEAIKDVEDKRWNTVLDISLIIGALHNPENADRRIVTEEKNIHTSFDDCGFENKILNLEEFKTLMGI